MQPILLGDKVEANAVDGILGLKLCPARKAVLADMPTDRLPLAFISEDECREAADWLLRAARELKTERIARKKNQKRRPYRRRA